MMMVHSFHGPMLSPSKVPFLPASFQKMTVSWISRLKVLLSLLMLFAAFAAACPCSLPALCEEGTRSMLYRPDRVARQCGYDQGAPGRAPLLRSYAESLRRFTRAHVEELAEGYNVVVLSRNDRETFFTANGRLAWRRNLDSFINYVRGASEVSAFSDVYHRDVSLRRIM
ncbi:hypothetical protein RHGRI_000829 [Rhododendron griersonianum]|uniref:Uncharacterized protein n=1 Tax=Rhododendron griersonianum TaxID=479676 RepID=A0AAV6LJ69_9ERIC|nr:hypothetical protein RHGRI_000829 [Rhododendron griersonianum]